MKNSDFSTKNMSVQNNPIKPASRWVFLGFIGQVFLGGFFIANPDTTGKNPQVFATVPFFAQKLDTGAVVLVRKIKTFYLKKH
jgi:hypothetical protein